VICKKMFKMNITISIIITSLFITTFGFGQDGKIISKEPFVLPDSVLNRIAISDTVLSRKLGSVNFYRIIYLSDGLKVVGYLSEPKQAGKFPCIIVNRGGSLGFGSLNPFLIAFILGRIATWNYISIGSQYRGNDGGEGKEEYGGKDLDDVLNLMLVLSQLSNADTTRIGIEGVSRGGMMTYLALKKTCRFKAAVVVSGLADAYKNIANRPDMENVFERLVPNYKTNKESELKARSAVFWADQMCKTTPLLIMHGSSDWRVLPEESLELVQKLVTFRHPTRFILYEGADHGIDEFRDQKFAEMKRHFDDYVRDGKKWPSMLPHGD
jgi:dipeptidyl aminopeptidase/acylaminoacyl peptidase